MILSWFPRLNEFLLNIVLDAPFPQIVRNELRTVIHSEFQGSAPELDETVKYPNYSLRRKIEINLDRESLAVEVFQHIERPESS